MVDHSRDEANAALATGANRRAAMAAALVEQAQVGPEESARLEEERQAAYRYYQATGKDILDLETEDEPRVYVSGEEDDGEFMSSGSLQDRMSALATLMVEEPAEQWARGGTTVLRWGVTGSEEDPTGFTLGVSVAYNTGEPADLYLEITEQRLKEWRSLQGTDGEKRLALKLVTNLLQIAGEDIVADIVSALGELVAGVDETIHQDLPTETAVGTADDEADDYDDDALTTEDGS